MVHGLLELVTVFEQGCWRLSCFVRVVRAFQKQSTVFDWIEPVNIVAALYLFK
jgi:hypothetical protein